ncbi:MAG: hypothetical protein WAM69_18770 [Candidatus Sulfotelmatobacter sp.]
MRKAMVVWLLAAVMTLCSGSKPSQAQDTASKAEPAPKPVEAYRLDFSFNELENGKKVNSRRYSINLNVPGQSRDVKISTRVPVCTGSNGPDNSNPCSQYQYIDVGTNITSEMNQRGDGQLELRVNSEVSNIDIEREHEHNVPRAPVIREIKIEGSTVVVLGKPIVIGSVDDPNSESQFQLEVTVTKLK